MTLLAALTAALLSSGAAPAPEPPVDWAVAIFPSGAEFTLEIAADPAARRLGYMFRESVGPDQGMLFLFEGPGRHSIWMKNCLVALDIIWLDNTWRVVEIDYERPPCPEQGDCPAVAPMREARFVLEVAAGSARKHGLELGDRIEIVSEPPLTP